MITKNGGVKNTLGYPCMIKYLFCYHIPCDFLGSHIQLDQIHQDRLRHSESHIFVRLCIGGYEISETQTPETLIYKSS